MATPHISWSAPEYEFREKTPAWYWASIAIAVLCIVYALWSRTYLFAVFIVIAEVLIIVWGNEPARMVDFSLSPKGLSIDRKKTYSLSQIDHFSIEDLDHADWPNLIFHFKKAFHIGFKVHVPRPQLAEIRAILAGAGVKERDREETLIEVLEEFLGF